ncbi:LVIVD repeat protein precursor [Sphingomonas sp. MM-1]|uniref:LVIVD repeat protein precursor n=1 Tax=Sphingomonas sp. MM-1 TaxID=745310 RepID=UPI0002C07B6A|nr:LVIVD repeat protein precursor [Sphingomonas sp. MM-1]
MGMGATFLKRAMLVAALLAGMAGGSSGLASEGEKPRAITYAFTAPAPAGQSWAEADEKSAGCVSCHTASDQKTMHASPAVVLGCVDCHGGDATVRGDARLPHDAPAYVAARDKAHVLPRYPESWHWPSSANPKRSYTLLNREAPEYIRFVNPSDYRVARAACGACHIEIIEAAERSLMSTGAMLWGGAAYNNGILPYKNYMFGEAYTQKGEPAQVKSPGSPPGTVTDAQANRGALATLYPLPTWHVVPPGDVFRVFERGGRNIGTQFPEIGLPNIGGTIQRLEEPGRPDLRQSNRGPGTGLRVAIPVLNVHKTRLNDPFMWFMGTNDQPGDYRNSGCAGCHVIYANDREPRHSLIYARYGRDGQTATADPTIAAKMEPADDGHGHGKAKGPVPADHPVAPGIKEKGHPIRHAFTRAIPTAQCMNCHMHQPNIFLNSYLGYTMWDYESDAPLMWPNPENPLAPPAGKAADAYKKQKYPTAAEVHAVLDRNPEGASPRGLWADVDFLRNVYDDVNARAKDTQFADYHGHGWNFRAIFKRDREGNLLDAAGNIVKPDDPEKFRLYRRNAAGQFVDEHGTVLDPADPDLDRKAKPMFADVGQQPGKAVHMMDIHAEKGLQCADCHFAQDSHGNGLIYGEVANAVEIGCKDCHGTADAYPTLRTSGPAARPGGTDLSLLRNADGRRRFEWVEKAGQRVLVQRSIVDPKLEWEVSLVKDAVTEGNPHFNLKAARAKLMSREGAETGRYVFGPGVAMEDRAHKDPDMACFTCHLSWTTSCGGCHLPIEANWKTSNHKYDGIETRNFATYNPQVARDEMFQLGRHQTTKGNQIAPVRSTSALVLSSTNINRERIYIQQPPISAIGFSSQAFAPHFPHTVRKTETKTCSDCHLSAANDNNAIMAQTLLLGTNFVNFVGMNAWTGEQDGFQAIRVTEWEEPQAVIGSYLHKYAYPDYWKAHQDHGRELLEWRRGRAFDRKLSGETRAVEEFANPRQGAPDAVRCLQLRGEYMFVAQGKGGFQAYDVASIANKGFSERILTAPVSPLGQDMRVKSANATCMALPTMQAIAPTRNTADLRALNQEQPFHPIYHYAFVTDAEEGLIVVNVDTLADGEPRNNFLRRDATWNADNVLKGARHITLGGHYAYIAADAGLVVVDVDDPLHPRLSAVLPVRDARASALQFRYLWVTSAEGVQLFDVTDLARPRPVPEATIPLADARRLYVARTYAYVAAKQDGLVILDVKNPERPSIYRKVRLEGAAHPIDDAEDVIVGTTNASLFAYVADGRNGLKVLQLTSPASQPNFYGFSPAPVPELIAWARTPAPALALSKGLDRDRAVDESGGQIAVFGRLGSRPFTRPEMERLFLSRRGIPYKVVDTPSFADWLPARAARR